MGRCIVDHPSSCLSNKVIHSLLIGRRSAQGVYRDFRTTEAEQSGVRIVDDQIICAWNSNDEPERSAALPFQTGHIVSRCSAAVGLILVRVQDICINRVPLR